MVKCSNCGEINPDGSKFCSNCGNAFGPNTNTSDLNQNMPPKGDNVQNINNQGNNLNQNNLNRNNLNQANLNQNNVNQNSQNYNNPNYNRQNYNGQNYNGQQNESITDKISNLSTPVKVVGGVLILCCIGILILAAFGGGSSDQGSLPSNTNYSSTPSFSFDSSDKAKCQEINYKELNKNPEKYTGEYIKVSGKVLQISEGSSSSNFLLMYVNGDYNQLVYVGYLNDTNIVEEDWITVYGICDGSYSYDTTAGGSQTVPYIIGGSLEK